MTDFRKFSEAVSRQFERMQTSGALFVTAGDAETRWATYLDSFAPGANVVFRTRREYDCQCCKRFIRDVGGVVAFIDGQMTSIWDVEVPDPFTEVAQALHDSVTSAEIRDVFRTKEGKAGQVSNIQLMENGETLRWHHFHCDIDRRLRVPGAESVAAAQSTYRAAKEVFQRSLQEITAEATQTVLELVAQGSLYRGEEHLDTLHAFAEHQANYAALPAADHPQYCWEVAATLGPAAMYRNTVIGTLLVDLSNDVPLDAAVAAFEQKVAPANYKRPKSLVTPRMIAAAEETTVALGLEKSIHRRYAQADDITVNNVRFADRSVQPALGVFGGLAATAPVSVGSLKRVEEVALQDFLTQIVPKAESIELLLENRLEGNLVSLIAPEHADAPNILKWDNNFSWAYNGEVTDSIKERVKQAGGRIDAALRWSLAWYNYDDLDLHVVEPDGTHIYFSNKRSPKTGGYLDVDMNAGGGRSREPVENVAWPDRARMAEGKYRVQVHQYNKREAADVGFEVQMEFEGETQSFTYPKPASGLIDVATFDYTHAGGVQNITSALSSTSAKKDLWGLPSGEFHTVSMVMDSPNFWDGQRVGNQHAFFILKGCTNDAPARGFFNEFLRGDLTEHRKVFEVLGAKLRAPVASEQLSGLGFSSTQRNHVFCRVKGSFTRIIKINF